MYYTKSRFYESSEVDKNLVVDISSVKLIDKNSLLVENTCLKLKELHKKAVVYQSVFSPSMEYRDKSYYYTYQKSVLQKIWGGQKFSCRHKLCKTCRQIFSISWKYWPQAERVRQRGSSIPECVYPSK